MSRQVERMFASIAQDYDRANSVLSLGIHHRWRRKTVALSRAKPGDAVLDVASGTGDLAFAFERAVGSAGSVVGLDFCSPMVGRAVEKEARDRRRSSFVLGDALALPFRSESFDVAAIAFGIRNLDNPGKGVAEMARVVRTGGRLAILEFGQPKGPFGAAFRLYSRLVMPRVGGILTGNREAYEYLPRTAASFPSGAAFLKLMANAYEFSEMKAHRLQGGVAYVYVGTVGPV